VPIVIKPPILVETFRHLDGEQSVEAILENGPNVQIVVSQCLAEFSRSRQGAEDMAGLKLLSHPEAQIVQGF
jgi:hypothetical protein